MKKVILLVAYCLLGWGTTGLWAQQGFVATGGDASGAGGGVSYSFGQVDYLSAAGTGGSVNQGLQHPGGYSLSGTLSYDNALGSGLSNSTVQLKQGNTVISQTTTNGDGYYSFNNPAAGQYTLAVLTSKAWGSVNATDALLCQKHFVEISLLSGLKLIAGDVNLSAYVNSTDGLAIQKRFVGLQSSYASGDWYFQAPVVVLDGSTNTTSDIKGICFGDVNGSYDPSGTKHQPDLFVENQGVQQIDGQVLVSVPVRVKESLNMAAMSLVLNYPANDMDVLGVEAAYDNQSLVYNTMGNELRIAWYTLQPKAINADETLLTLKLKLKNANNPSTDLNLSINTDESSLADFNGGKIINKTLLIPSLVNNGNGFSLSQNVPNPYKDVTLIAYAIPVDGNVKLEVLDLIGQSVAVLQDGLMSAGAYTYSMSGSVLPSGVYFYKMTVGTSTTLFTQTKRMVISR
ncbi:MAG: T9SS type A sorting domain-containing protein [Bacteroidota bacterium]